MTIDKEKSEINIQNETSFKDMDTYLRVSISGKWISELILETLLYIKKKADLTNHTRILIDCFELAPPRGDFERIFAGLDVALILKHPFRIAVLYPLESTLGYVILTVFCDRRLSQGELYFRDFWLLP